MNKNKAEGYWNEQKEKLKQKFATLTENDLIFAEGKKEEMLGKLQTKFSKTKEELNKIITGV
ncbi:MAG: csbd family [Prolixibacteraceae bacterium]|nr:MAG: csbd family [Prolixibacteraceae bacterium]